MKTWAFIFNSGESDPAVDYMEMIHEGVRLLVYGVSSVEEGAALSKRIVEEEGVYLIELCGGFKEEGARMVEQAVEGRAKVGYIVYPAKT